MKSLKSLIRLHRHRVDERRRQLKDLESMREQFLAAAASLNEALAAEGAVASAAPETAFTYGDYATSVRERRDKLFTSIEEVDGQITAAREALSEAYQDLKKYEITQANRDRVAAVRAARIEQATLDEVGLNMYRRGRTSA